jgi:hypothetical protein
MLKLYTPWPHPPPLFQSTYTSISYFQKGARYSSAIEYKLIYSALDRSIRSLYAAPSGGFFSPAFTFLHFALLADAPKVAAALMKNGTDISQELEDYPDLMPLYLTLPRSLGTVGSSSKDLDSALRIACSYALPNIAGFLLTRGANANTNARRGEVLRDRRRRNCICHMNHLVRLMRSSGI